MGTRCTLNRASNKVSDDQLRILRISIAVRHRPPTIAPVAMGPRHQTMAGLRSDITHRTGMPSTMVKTAPEGDTGYKLQWQQLLKHHCCQKMQSRSSRHRLARISMRAQLSSSAMGFTLPLPDNMHFVYATTATRSIGLTNPAITRSQPIQLSQIHSDTT